MNFQKILKRVNLLMSAAIKSTNDQKSKNRISDVHTCLGYSEPGYEGVPVFGNWNDINDNIMHRLCDAITKYTDAEIEWSDEWVVCDCGYAVRVRGDCYQWKPYHSDGIFGNCILADPVEYLESLEGDPRKALVIPVGLSNHGYKKVEDKYENGLHGGQADDPRIIAATLTKLGIKRFIFSLDEVSQFYSTFSLYVHKSEYKLFRKKHSEFIGSNTKGEDPAVVVERALRSIPFNKSGDGPGVNIHKILPDGTVESTKISHEDFVAGKAGIK